MPKPAEEVDAVERAHLRDADGFSPPIARLAPTPALRDLVRRYWVPVWTLPAGTTSVQRVLQYPVCLIVIADTYASFVGPTTAYAAMESLGVVNDHLAGCHVRDACEEDRRAVLPPEGAY